MTKPPGWNVEHTHFVELPSVGEQLARYRARGDPTGLYNPALVDHLESHPDKRSFKLVVRTVGERSVVEMNGPADRTIRGWRPTEGEIGELSRYGEVGFAAEVASTTVSLHGVDRADIPAVARLPFALEVNWDPPLSFEEGVSTENLRGSEYFQFTDVPEDVSLPSWLRIGILDGGYGGSGSFEIPHAEAVGIDEELATDFTDEGDWRTADDHGSDVTNICARMLAGGHDDLFVPLKVRPVNHTSSRLDVQDSVRAAIEFAEMNGIDVLNISLGTSGVRTACPSLYCPELYSYTQAGFLPFAAVGNLDVNGVEFPGGEWTTIGVGGVTHDCSSGNGYERFEDDAGYYGSSYGYIQFHDPFEQMTHCHYCRAASEGVGEFSPKVYGSYVVETDAGEALHGTSYASPQAAAVGAIMRGNGLADYGQAESIFRAMDGYIVCPDEAAGEGQLLDAAYAYEQTK